VVIGPVDGQRAEAGGEIVQDVVGAVVVVVLLLLGGGGVGLAQAAAAGELDLPGGFREIGAVRVPEAAEEAVVEAAGRGGWVIAIGGDDVVEIAADGERRGRRHRPSRPRRNAIESRECGGEDLASGDWWWWLRRGRDRVGWIYQQGGTGRGMAVATNSPQWTAGHFKFRAALRGRGLLPAAQRDGIGGAQRDGTNCGRTQYWWMTLSKRKIIRGLVRCPWR